MGPMNERVQVGGLGTTGWGPTRRKTGPLIGSLAARIHSVLINHISCNRLRLSKELSTHIILGDAGPTKTAEGRCPICLCLTRAVLTGHNQPSWST